MEAQSPSHTELVSRKSLIEFLIRSSLQQLRVSPGVKYTSLSLFADRFLPSLSNPNSRLIDSWLLQQPFKESNLQLFALVSLWISTKIHNTPPLSVKSLKSLGDEVIQDQRFTTRDFVQAEIVFMQVTRFEIGALNITFFFLQDYLIHFRQLSKVGELISTDACMDVMDLLYETEELSTLYGLPSLLAAVVLVVVYIISVPKQHMEFPVLSWAIFVQMITDSLLQPISHLLAVVKFITSYEVKDIEEQVTRILHRLLKQPCEEASC